MAIILLNVILYYKSSVGRADGCSQDTMMNLMETLTSDRFNANTSTLSLSNSFLEGPGALAILNFGFIFFAIIFVAFLSMMPVILTFPMEVGVFYKEYFNGWYSFSSYFIAKNLTNLLPTLFLPFVFGVSAYFITGQIWMQWRFIYFVVILLLISLVADGIGKCSSLMDKLIHSCFSVPGLTVSAFFVHNVNAASIFAAISQIPLLLFTGLLVQINTLPRFIRPLTYLSYYRLSFETALITIYGYDRCHKVENPFDMKKIRKFIGDDVEEVMDCVWQHTSIFEASDPNGPPSLLDRFNRISTIIGKQNPSLVMQNFDLKDEDLHYEIGLLVVYAIVMRFIAYIILYRKASAQK